MSDKPRNQILKESDEDALVFSLTDNKQNGSPKSMICAYVPDEAENNHQLINLFEIEGTVTSIIDNQDKIYCTAKRSVLKGGETEYKGEIWDILSNTCIANIDASVNNLTQCNDQLFYSTFIPEKRRGNKKSKSMIFQLDENQSFWKFTKRNKPIFDTNGHITEMICSGNELYCSVLSGTDEKSRGIWNVFEKERINEISANSMCAHEGQIYHSNSYGTYETFTGRKVSTTIPEDRKDRIAHDMISYERTLYGRYDRMVMDILQGEIIPEKYPKETSYAMQGKRDFIIYNGTLYTLASAERIERTDSEESYRPIIINSKDTNCKRLDAFKLFKTEERNILYDTMGEGYITLPPNISAITSVPKSVIKPKMR
ncbi:MAG: hypothetical protein KAH93_00375 [Candidatus Aenigmarchaeota archaeon]|nr:hypothetical protein [Candidatus Aenigmarchaeota archaeon]